MNVEPTQSGALFKPTETDAAVVKKALGGVSRMLRALQQSEQNPETDSSTRRTVMLRSNGDELELPIEVFSMIKEILGQMAQGHSIMLVPAEKEIGTQEIAHLLNVSRPTVVKLMETGQIPFTTTGTGGHRRASYRDVVEYKHRLEQRRSEGLDKLARIAQENNMGYED